MSIVASTFPLLAQTGQLSEDEVVGLIAMLIIFAIVLVITFAISIVICAMLYVVQKRVPVEHRKIEPLHIWLLLIPFFNIVWNFFVFQRVPASYQSYFNAQGRTDVGDCGKQIGLWYAICAVVSIVPCVNYIAGPAALVLLIIFLVKMFGYRNMIPAEPATA